MARNKTDSEPHKTRRQLSQSRYEEKWVPPFITVSQKALTHLRSGIWSSDALQNRKRATIMTGDQEGIEAYRRGARKASERYRMRHRQEIATTAKERRRKLAAESPSTSPTRTHANDSSMLANQNQTALAQAARKKLAAKCSALPAPPQAGEAGTPTNRSSESMSRCAATVANLFDSPAKSFYSSGLRPATSTVTKTAPLAPSNPPSSDRIASTHPASSGAQLLRQLDVKRRTKTVVGKRLQTKPPPSPAPQVHDESSADDEMTEWVDEHWAFSRLKWDYSKRPAVDGPCPFAGCSEESCPGCACVCKATNIWIKHWGGHHCTPPHGCLFK
ncbi:hypothetical protein C8F01DRAFT_1091767 [Mycena amicta]|nr:hypothetical protein C8F01DRAFT_1091767 [Mycena amicta]